MGSVQEDNLEIQAEIEAAKQTYEVGDYLTLDEYTKKTRSRLPNNSYCQNSL
ncbi:hypothetical protein [Spirulina sp. 06S082]|uniref:hypothetical protein n=1 Tax=Spirulina sp. 06S082 TaxID=3110248 RepID=UPI002B1FEE97|nr:hypothetical protein [Spirulina sp. 06S082]MEA5468653.1 hypothetical protein [Spirulina sp. 06S082]